VLRRVWVRLIVRYSRRHPKQRGTPDKLHPQTGGAFTGLSYSSIGRLERHCKHLLWHSAKSDNGFYKMLPSPLPNWSPFRMNT
jgi:hypothetical protein